MTFAPQLSARPRTSYLQAPLLVAVIVLVGTVSRALHGAEADGSGACAGFVKLYGSYLADGRTDLADQVDDRARAAGCFEVLGDEKICALFADLESQFDLSGRADLSNIIRARERAFQCIQ